MQVPQDHLVEELRQARAAQAHLFGRRIDLQPEGGLKQAEWGCAGPGLRRAGHGVKRWTSTTRPMKAAKQFGQAMQVQVGSGIEKTIEEAVDRTLGADLRKAESHQRVVVRPNRAIVIRHWIVADFTTRHRANAPPGEE